MAVACKSSGSLPRAVHTHSRIARRSISSSTEDSKEPALTLRGNASKGISPRFLSLRHLKHTLRNMPRSQPPTHRLGLAKLVDGAQSYEKGFLNSVLYIGAVAQDTEGQSVKRSPVAFEQDPEARGVAPLGCPRKFSVTQHRGLL